MFNLGGSELFVIALIALLVYDPKQLPEVVRQGARAWKGVREIAHSMNRELSGALRDLELDFDDDTKPSQITPVDEPRPYQSPQFTPPPSATDEDPYVAAMRPEDPPS